MQMAAIPILQHSWKVFISTRCHNVNRRKSHHQCAEGEPPFKRRKMSSREKHTYPPMEPTIPADEEDGDTDEQYELLKQELACPPKLRRPDIICSLMERTFPQRRQWILDNDDIQPQLVLKMYPPLEKIQQVS